MKTKPPAGPKPTVRPPSVLLLALLIGTGVSIDAAQKPVSKWEVFEDDFKSSIRYDNPPQDVQLTVDFVSPTGQTNRVHGFWNGGTKWGVRFRPNQLGRWTYFTHCSDSRNETLDGRSDSFLCIVQSTRTALQKHGAIKVTPGSFIFQYGDGTPFFWLSDGVWDGTRNATKKEWGEYAQARATQGFNIALWTAAPGTDDHNRRAYTGTNSIELDVRFLKGLDDRIEMLNQSDLVSAIVPLWEIGVDEKDLLPEDQVIVLLRQMAARWDAFHVAWVIAFEADTSGRRAARWRRIGRSVFDGTYHSPVILFCGSTHWALKDFAEEKWIKAVAFESGYEVSEKATLWLAKGPPTALWKTEPFRPILNLLPAREAGYTPGGHAITSANTIEALARSLFVAPPAGLCYQSRPIAQWHRQIDTNSAAATGLDLTEWQVGLHLPGAVRAAEIKDWVVENKLWRLMPSASVLLPSSENDPGAAPMTALASPARDKALIYVPEGQTARLSPKGLHSGLTGTFFSLQSGKTRTAESAVKDGITTYTAPGSGDWLLLLTQPAG